MRAFFWSPPRESGLETQSRRQKVYAEAILQQFNELGKWTVSTAT